MRSFVQALYFSTAETIIFHTIAAEVISNSRSGIFVKKIHSGSEDCNLLELFVVRLTLELRCACLDNGMKY